jgi:hypothetical protein
MSERRDNGRHVRRLVLPSGKAIEVVYFEERPRGAEDVPDDLHRCAVCDSRLVYPVDWQEASTTHWEVSLRCPNCGWTGTGVFDQACVERFDEELDRGTAILISDLKRLAHSNLEDEVLRFATALEANAILPEDFGF